MDELRTRPAALECKDITVAYGDFLALSDVSVQFEEGLIHAVVGQNGAGKTTFARVAAGLVRPRHGVLTIGKQVVAGGNVKDSRRAGVELVHQSFALPPSFTVSEAIEFGAQRHSGFFTVRQLDKRWKHHLHTLDVTVDPRRRIRDLPVETQQGVEIARALVSDAKVLILDEPTAVLSPTGIEKLFERVRTLKANGITVILILHKIREVLGIADTFTVLRGGKLIAATLPRKEVDASRLANLIIGGAPDLADQHSDVAAIVGTQAVSEISHETSNAKGPAILTIENLNSTPSSEGPALEDIMLSIRPGEIVGVAGIEGNGQKPLVEAIAALADLRSGRISLAGVDVSQSDLAARRSLGLRIIPFERNTEGLSLSSSLWENWSAGKLIAGGLLRSASPSKLRRESKTALDAWDVRYNTPTQRAGSLSGGNAQKVIFAREMDDDAKLIIAAQPTRGLDIGATAFVWKALKDARDRGCAVLLISSDLDELFDISDRIIVMLAGRIAGQFDAPFNINEIGAAMTGATK
jgi:ABC-type uncharacterized transport system ATPase subunit